MAREKEGRNVQREGKREKERSKREMEKKKKGERMSEWREKGR